MENDQLDRRIRSREIDTSDFYFEVIISVTQLFGFHDQKSRLCRTKFCKIARKKTTWK